MADLVVGRSEGVTSYDLSNIKPILKETNRPMLEDIKLLLEEIVGDYEGEGYTVNAIPKEIHDIAEKYGFDLNEF